MANWNDALNKARQEFPDPFNDPARTKKGRGWGKQTPQRTPPDLIDVMGKTYTSHPLERKASAPDRVMDKAMEYHAIESNRRQAKHQARIKNPNRFDLPLVIGVILFCCIGIYLLPVITGLPW